MTPIEKLAVETAVTLTLVVAPAIFKAVAAKRAEKKRLIVENIYVLKPKHYGTAR